MADTPTSEPKPLLKSKTIIVNAVVAVAALYPPAQQFVADHAALVLSSLGLVNMVLRMVTKDKIVLFSDS